VLKRFANCLQYVNILFSFNHYRHILQLMAESIQKSQHKSVLHKLYLRSVLNRFIQLVQSIM